MTKATWQAKRYAPSNVVARRYEVDWATLDRWLRDETQAMPRPTRIGGSFYWDEDQLNAWDRARGLRP
jgi:predicted DNA-binding transcriptional regulator AlpA